MGEIPDKRDSARIGAERMKQQRTLKMLAWVAGCVLLLILLVGSILAILLQSARFHQYVLRTVRARASEALGVRVQLRDFDLQLTSLGLDLYGVVVDGAQPMANPPLLQVDHAQVSIRIVSLLQRTWYLDTVAIDRPVVRVYVDVNGVSNIPTIKGNGSSSNKSIFDLAIRHALLTNGQVYYNDRKSDLAADLKDVDFHSTFNSLLDQYAGHLAYEEGHLETGSLATVQHRLDLDFTATPKVFVLTHAALASGASKLTVTGTVHDYVHPIVDAEYDALLDGSQIGRVLRSAAVPRGQVHVNGTLKYTSVEGRPLLRSFASSGTLQSSSLDVVAPSFRAAIKNLGARFDFTDGTVTLQDVHANTLGGYLRASGTMADVAADRQAKVDASLSNVSLAELRRAAGAAHSIADVSLDGTLNAHAAASLGKTLDTLLVKTDATMQGHVLQAGNTASAIAVESAIHGVYTGRDGQIALTQTYLRTPQTSITAQGLVGRRSKMMVQLRAGDLHEVEELVSLFRPQHPGTSVGTLGLAGTASFDGTVQGSVQAPQVAGVFTARDFHVRDTAWKKLQTHVDLSPSLVRLDHAELDAGEHGRISMTAQAVLDHWAIQNTSVIDVDLDVRQLDIAQVEQIAGQKIPVTGQLNTRVHMRGTAMNPEGNGNASLTQLVAYGQPVPSATLAFEGKDGQVRGTVAVRVAEGTVHAEVSARPQQRDYTVQISAAGIKLDAIEAVRARKMDATGVLGLDAHGQGSFDNPALDAVVKIPELVVQEQKISGITLTVGLANHVAQGTLNASALNSAMRANGTVHLSGDYQANAALDTQAIPLRPLLALLAPDQVESLSGETEVHATLHGPLKDRTQLEAHLLIPKLQVGYSNTIQLAAAAPIRADFKNGVVELQRTQIKGTDTDLVVQGTYPVEGGSPISTTAQGTLNLQIAQLFDPDVRSAGTVKFDIKASGDARAPRMGGQVEIVDAAYGSADLPVGLQHANGVLRLDQDHLTIASLQGTVGGGTLTASGSIALQPRLRFDIGVTAQGVRMIYPQGVRETADADVRLNGTMQSARLNGSVNLSDLSFTNAFDPTTLINELSGGVAAPPTPGFAQNLRLNLAVRSTNDINLVSRTLSVDGSANLQVRGTAATPVILGRVNLNSGDMILNGERFLLDGGTVEFVNPSETQAVLNLSLKTTIQQYDVYLRFNGPADQLHTNYSSDPALPSADIINLLAFGKTTESGSADAATPTNQAAASLVASQVSSQVTSRVSKIAGISQLSINPVLAGGTAQGPAGANITIQQRVTGNLFVTFSTNVAATQSQTIQGQYQLTPKVAISATRDPNGGFAFDTLIKKTW